MNVKYYAGLFDSDGSFQIQAVKLNNGNFKIHAKATICQLQFRDRPLKELADYFQVSLYDKGTKPHETAATQFVVVGNKALTLIQKIKNHLVIKKEVAEFIEQVHGQEVNEIVLKTIRGLLKELRYEIHPLTNNHPSSGWMAGYIDGDGCLRSQLSNRGKLDTKLEVTSYDRDMQGVELLKKAFGGSIHKHGQNAVRWVLHLNESNAQKVLGYFSNHSRIKRTQVLFVLDYLNKGKHLKKRGATFDSNKELKEKLQNLKQPQRLNEKGR